MTTFGISEFLAMQAEWFSSIQALTQKKNADYATARETDPFANFRLVEAYGVTTAEVGLFTRMSDKMARLASFVKAGKLQVEDEGVHDTLKDLANYSFIMSAFIKAKAAGASDVELREFWLNIYPGHDDTPIAHTSKGRADAEAGETRTACVHVREVKP